MKKRWLFLPVGVLLILAVRLMGGPSFDVPDGRAIVRQELQQLNVQATQTAAAPKPLATPLFRPRPTFTLPTPVTLPRPVPVILTPITVLPTPMILPTPEPVILTPITAPSAVPTPTRLATPTPLARKLPLATLTPLTPPAPNLLPDGG